MAGCQLRIAACRYDASSRMLLDSAGMDCVIGTTRTARSHWASRP